MKNHLLLILMLLIAFSNRSGAQSGALDASFATQGLLSNEEFPTPVLQSGVFTSNDKIYTVLQAVNVGNPTTYIRAYNLDGTIYSNFGANGTLTIADFAAYDATFSTNQNKIYLGGQTTNGEDGFIDVDLITELHSLNIYSVEPDYSDINYLMSLTDNNEVILSGYHINTITNLGAIRIIKFDSEMMLDNSFGVNGKVTLQELEGTNGSLYGVEDMEVDSDGNIFLIGRIDPERKILKLLSTGEIDMNFVQTSELTAFVALNDLLIIPDGHLVVVPSSTNTQYVIRLNANGSIDTSFANDGIFHMDSPNPDHLIYLKNGLIEDDGSIVFIGSYLSYATSNFEGKSLIKLDQNGVVDPQFELISNDIGYVCGYNVSYGWSNVTFQADGKILCIDFITCYDTETSVYQENILTRFLNDATSNVSETDESTLLTYPNPAHNVIRLMRNGEGMRSSNIKIYDSLGNLVLVEGMTNEEVDIENLAPGFYSIHIIEKNNSSVTHFVKE